MVVRWHSPPLIGVSYWRRKAKRLLHREHSKYSAALTGDPFTALSGSKAWGQRKRRISLKLFSRCCWSAKVLIGFARKKAGCVRICWFRSKIFSLMSEAVRWQLSEVVASEWYLWKSCATKR